MESWGLPTVAPILRMDTMRSSRYTEFMSVQIRLPEVVRRSRALDELAWNRWDEKVKPRFSLGRLEHIAVEIVGMIGSLTPPIEIPQLILFAADHGIVSEGVSSSPQEITWQQCENFSRGGGAIGLLCEQNGIDLHVVDVGVAYAFPSSSAVIDRKVAWGTRSFLDSPAMDKRQLEEAICAGQLSVRQLAERGHHYFVFGEMGIGNTSSASALMVCLTGNTVEQCTGRGAGMDDAGYACKCSSIAQALQNQGRLDEPLEALRVYGGFEIAAMMGAMIEAAHRRCVVLVDGFIATVAAALAQRLRPEVMDYLIFCHESAESGHALLLSHLSVTPLLSLGMCLGEGSGAAVTWPVIRNALQLYVDMNSFTAAQVTDSVSLLRAKGDYCHERR